jgi:hypothetical protein
MNYALFAIACYIVMRGLQVLLEEHLQKRWCRILVKAWTVFTLYAALASLLVYYLGKVHFLGFAPGD